MKVLLIEDEAGITKFIKAGLESEYFTVDNAEDGEQGSFLARTNDYDIIILDNMLPQKNGLEVCQEIRAAGKDTPVIVLSAQAEMTRKVELLNAGADDYLTKPFSLEELIARIRALTRRPKDLSSDTIRVGELVMDTKQHSVTLNNKHVHLTKKEFMLLELLLRRRNTVVSRALIIEHVWDMNADPFSNTLESHILNLRKKISVRGKNSIIQTIPGVGYKIDSSDSQ